jgi:hypothetical protein
LHLPVHRIGHGKRSPVYANVAELRFWLNTSDIARQEYGDSPSQANHVVPPKPRPVLVTRSGTPIENAQRLLSTARDLARKMQKTREPNPPKQKKRRPQTLARRPREK